MLANFDINHLLTFPVKDRDAINKSLIGLVVVLLTFIIPVLPMLALAGYTARIVRQVLDGQKPSMPAWDDWEAMLKDGARILAVRMIYAAPLLLLLIVVFGLISLLPVFAETAGDPDSAGVFILFPLLVFGSMVVTVPFSFFLGIVLACLVPLLMPAMGFYMNVIMYAAFAQAYKTGSEMPVQEPARQE